MGEISTTICQFQQGFPALFSLGYFRGIHTNTNSVAMHHSARSVHTGLHASTLSTSLLSGPAFPLLCLTIHFLKFPQECFTSFDDRPRAQFPFLTGLLWSMSVHEFHCRLSVAQFEVGIYRLRWFWVVLLAVPNPSGQTLSSFLQVVRGVCTIREIVRTKFCKWCLH